MLLKKKKGLKNKAHEKYQDLIEEKKDGNMSKNNKKIFQ